MFETMKDDLMIWVAKIFISVPKFQLYKSVIYTDPSGREINGIIKGIRFVRPDDGSKKRGWVYDLTLIESGVGEVILFITNVYTVPEAWLSSVVTP